MTPSTPRARFTLAAALQDGSVALLAPFILAGMLGVYVKHVQMKLPSGYLAISRFIGRASIADLGALDRLSFYANDFALELLAIPIVMVLLLRLAPRLRLPAAIAAATTLCVVHFMGILSLGSVGRYLSSAMILDAARWARDDPGIIPEYVTAGSVTKLLVLLALVVATSWLAVYPRRRPLQRGIARTVEALSLVALTGGAILALVAELRPMPNMPHHRSELISALGALREQAPSRIVRAGQSTADLLALSRDIARTPPIVAQSPLFGREQGKNLLVFVFETGPQRSLDFVTEGRSLVGASQLMDHSFVSRRHFTTYPYTSDAIFSLLTGLYPLGRREFLNADDRSPDLGLLNLLHRHGYACPVYSPVKDSFEDDTKMFNSIGATERFMAPGTDQELKALAKQRAAALLASLPPPQHPRAPVLTHRLVNDFIILERLKSDIVRFSTKGEPFAAVFMPQIGHGPWYDLYNDSSIVARGRRLMGLQDAWLAEIIAVLKKQGLLDRTVILVTADHGIRTRMEDPEFEAGQVSDYSFNVPLLLYAPSTVRTTTELRGITSHIDLTPTILTLLGIPEVTDYPSQGLPLWEAAATPRRVFFLAEGYLGADGYSEGGEYFMEQPLAGIISRSATMEFGAGGTVVTDAALAERLREPLRELRALQPLLLRSLLVPSLHPAAGDQTVAPQSNRRGVPILQAGY